MPSKQLPIGWKITKLVDYALFQEGPGLRNWQFCNNGIKIINVRNITNQRLKLENTKNFCSQLEVEKKYRHFLLQENDIVMASSGVTWGKTAIVKKSNLPLMLNTSVIRFRSLDESKLRRAYLKLFLNSSYFTRQINRLITGGCQPNFGPTHLKKVDLLLPPPVDQDRIVAGIDKIELARKYRNQADILTRDYISSIYVSLFSNKHGVKKTRLKEIVSFERKMVYPSSLKVNEWYIGLEQIEKDTGKILNNCSVESQDIKSAKFTFSENHVLYGRLRPYLNKVALPMFSGVCSTDILPITPIKELANRYFVAYLLRQPDFVKYASSRAAGANLPRINVDDLGDYEFYYPTLAKQSIFAELLDRINSLRKLQESSRVNIEHLYESIAQRTLNGD
jgi:type I restriction enzyme, S subunit